MAATGHVYKQRRIDRSTSSTDSFIISWMFLKNSSFGLITITSHSGTKNKIPRSIHFASLNLNIHQDFQKFS